MTFTNTSHFVSRAAALRYYSRLYTAFAAIVDEKIRSGEISIGEPPLRPGQTLGVDTEEGRYFIEESR